MIDTRNKRASVLGLGLTAQLVLPAPGSGTSATDVRQHLAGLYALAGSPAVDIPEGPRTLRFEVDARGLLLERSSRTLRFEV